jgi:hypothetical protein
VPPLPAAPPRDTLTRGATEPTDSGTLAERPAAFAGRSTPAGTFAEVAAQQPPARTAPATGAAALPADAGKTR